MTHISRRGFIAAATSGVTVSPTAFARSQQRTADITAENVIDRIRKNVGVEWKPDTVDTFKAGDPATVVSGVATTAMATMRVLAQAVKVGANLVITCEPTFYGRADSPTPPPARGVQAAPTADAVFAAKNEFIAKHELVIWRFSDHWRLRRPDPFSGGLADALGWSKLTMAGDPSRLSIPATTLDTLATELKRKLDSRGGIRVVGDPSMKVERIALLPGTTAIQASLDAMPNVDAIVAGEVREWESVEYARDLVTAGEKRALILLGRVVSEEPAMSVCATWLRTLVPETRTTWIRVGDPYWRPV
jgi:putative NIF3 family GTP cyclohydrolase 1 type 2